MKYLKIQNKGLLDVRLISLMGGTTKREQSYKIGQFGTGLKYTLAYVFRNNIDFKIFVGENEVKVRTEKENISGQDFDIIFIDDTRTSITTQMGYDWQAWMILRELWCNALDEGDAIKEKVSECSGEPDTTTFHIQITNEIKTVLDNWDNYFIPPDTIKFDENERFVIYPSSGNLRFYKQGVLIHENKQVSLFNYDIKNADINELREYKGVATYDIVQCLAKANSKTIEYFLTHVTDQHYEGDMSYDWYTSFSEIWKETIGTSKLITKEAVSNIKARGLEIDTAGLTILPQKVYDFLCKSFEGISALRVAGKVNDFFETHIPELELKIKQCLAILETCSYFIDPELVFIYGIFGDKTTFAQINIDKKEVLFSERLKDSSLFQVITAIIEENEHYRTGHSDCSRAFQQHFIDLYTKYLLDKNEVKI